MARMANKFTLKELQSLYGFNATTVARQAKIAVEDVEAMLAGRPVPREAALKFLEALSKQTRRRFTLNNVDIKVLSEKKNEEGTDGDGKSE